jgi:uncharacterized damage-inducible protein DinB
MIPPNLVNQEMTMFANREVELFWEYIIGSVERIIACLDGLGEGDLNWRPLENANSLYVLATHTMGNVEKNLLDALCGQPIERQREAEFVAHGSSVEPIRQRWRELQERVSVRLAPLSSDDLDREREHPHRGQITGREVLIVVARHAAEHAGQAELTRDFLFVARGKTPPPREY